mmetsp:Transcript_23090/g.64854  ORF Transcript_23090/g.64854 Transcript_23090/m.64854 type:complete len:576 (+) Transcript_23090:64-1791(+)
MGMGGLVGVVVGLVVLLLPGALGWTLHEGSAIHLYVPSMAEVTPDMYTGEWAVEFHHHVEDVHAVVAEHGMEILELIHHPSRKVFLVKESPNVERAFYPALNASEHVKWAEQQYELVREHRDIGSKDPQYPSQWHLHGVDGLSLRVDEVWESGFTGAGCQIAVVDDGLQYTNKDLSRNYVASSSYDFNYGDDDPYPDSRYDLHGTKAAGCAAASSNSFCGVGTAPEASIAGIRLISRKATDAKEAQALTYKPNKNVIYSNSWGPTDNGKTLEGPGHLTTSAMQETILSGRRGLGPLYVWAGGNGRQKKDNGNFDGYVNKIFTIPIGSYDSAGNQAYYSEDCACLLASAPSSGSSGTRGITTCASDGSGSQCISNFGGTSASAPMVSGIMCLLLQARPDLSWRDVQYLIVESSQVVKENDSSWKENGAGKLFSHRFGFGRIDAVELLNLAQEWENVPDSSYIDSGDIEGRTVSANGKETWVVPCSVDVTVEHLQLFFDITTARRGKITIDLISPSGMKSELMPQHDDFAQNYYWVASSVASWGESSLGDWTIEVSNLYTRDATVNSLRLFIDGILA